MHRATTSSLIAVLAVMLLTGVSRVQSAPAALADEATSAPDEHVNVNDAGARSRIDEGFAPTRTPASPWIHLRGELAGTHGAPSLSGLGSLAGGEPFSLILSGPLENSTAWLVAGYTLLNPPFKGGVLVPSGDVAGFPIPLPTGTSGELSVNGTWPLGIPSGFTTFLQYWVVDPVGPKGFSASNGLAATTP